MERKTRKRGILWTGIFGTAILVIGLLAILRREIPADNNNYDRNAGDNVDNSGRLAEYKDEGNVEDNPEIKENGIIGEFIDDQALGIPEYEYPSEFSMGENLKTAITQLALGYEKFNKETTEYEGWKEFFVDRFIQNTRASFEYLDLLSGKNNGRIDMNELDYIQYSLTGVELDFSSFADDPINRYDAASTLHYGLISGYDYEDTDQGVIVNADFEIGYDGTDTVIQRQLTITLVKNPYSCFDGYSIESVSSKTITPEGGL